MFNDGDLMIVPAVEGFGLAYIVEDLAGAQIADGRLTRILSEWYEPFAGYYLFEQALALASGA